MSESPLVTRKWWADPSNYTKGRGGYKIGGIVIHHAASTSLNSIGQVFSQKGRNGSAQYGVGGKEIHQYVSEADTAWHCSNYWGNQHTVGIETTNSTGGPEWRVSDETFDTLCKLVADVAKRNGLGKLYVNPSEDCPKLSGHKDWQGAATACPGPYLYPRLQEICNRANDINYPPKPAITWFDTPTTTMRVKAGGTNLVNTVTGTVVKALPAGEEFTYVQKTSDDKYVRTEYSKEKNVNNGVLLSALEPIPEPEPEPTPEPTPEPEPTPDPGEDVPNWFVKFIKDLINFLFGWIGKGKDK